MTMLAVLPVVIPLLSAAVAAVAGLYSRRMRNVLLVLLSLLALAVNTVLLYMVIYGGTETLVYNFIVANASGLFIAEIILFLGFLAVVYSLVYMAGEVDEGMYYTLLMFFIGTMVGMALTFNIAILYMFLEASTVTSAILVLYGRSRDAVSAANTYLVLSIFGAILLLVGIFVLYVTAGSLDLAAVGIQQMSRTVKVALALLFLFGFGIKAGIVPFGLVWLPRAHSEAPTPISSLLSGILVQVAAFTIARTVGSIALYDMTVSAFLVLFGVSSMIVGVACAICELFGVKIPLANFRFDIKRVLAFSTISEIGYIIMMVGLVGQIGAAMTIAFSAALMHILNHALAKALLFLSAGVIIFHAHTRDVRRFGGIVGRIPLTTFSFAVGGFSLAMIPPLFGYRTLSELYFEIFEHQINIYTLTVAVTMLLTLSLYIVALYRIFLQKPAAEVVEVEEAPPSMIVPLLAYVIVLLALGTGFFFNFITPEQLRLDLLAETVMKVSGGG